MADVIDDRLTLPSKCFRYLFETVTSPLPNMASSCRRCLFGRPDAGEVKRDLELLRERQQRRDVQKWNYNFPAGHPLSGRYDWQAVDTANRAPDSCDRLSERDLRDYDDQTGSGRPESLVSSTDTDAIAPSATRTSSQQHSTQSLSENSSAAVEVPDFPLKTRGTRRKHRINPPRSPAGGLKQSRRPRRRSIAKRHAQIFNIAGAARVTGQCNDTTFISILRVQ